MDRFIMLFKESYKCRDIIESLFNNDAFELTRVIGQTDDLSWFTGEYFQHFYEHVGEVYYYDDGCGDGCGDEWSCFVKLDNGFYFYMEATTDLNSGFTGYGESKMFACRDIDSMLTFGLTETARARVEKAQTEHVARAALLLLQ